MKRFLVALSLMMSPNLYAELTPGGTGSPASMTSGATITGTTLINGLDMSGGFLKSSMNSVNGNYTVLDDDGYSTINCADNGNQTITLPNPANNSGRTIKVLKTGNTSGNPDHLVVPGSFFTCTVAGTLAGRALQFDEVGVPLADYQINFRYHWADWFSDGTSWIIIDSSLDDGTIIGANAATTHTGLNVAGVGIMFAVTGNGGHVIDNTTRGRPGQTVMFGDDNSTSCVTLKNAFGSNQTFRGSGPADVSICAQAEAANCTLRFTTGVVYWFCVNRDQ